MKSSGLLGSPWVEASIAVLACGRWSPGLCFLLPPSPDWEVILQEASRPSTLDWCPCSFQLFGLSSFWLFPLSSAQMWALPLRSYRLPNQSPYRYTYVSYQFCGCRLLPLLNVIQHLNTQHLHINLSHKISSKYRTLLGDNNKAENKWRGHRVA